MEGHTQNILFEMNDAETLSGRIFLRDLSDMSVSLAHRIARKRPLPALEALRPKGAHGAPFALATSAADHHCGQSISTLGRAGATVERFGLRGFIWSINTSLIRYFPRYKARAIEREYLTLWRSETQRYLHIRPQLRTDRVGIRIDEAIATYLRERWSAPKRHRLPKGAEPLTRGKGSHSAVSASGLGRVESAWGDLFLSEGVPAYFYPAF